MIHAVFVLVLVAISYISIYDACNSPQYGNFFAMRDGFAKTDQNSGDTTNIIDESFHKCSNKKSCSKVAENVKTNTYKTVAVGQQLPVEQQDTRIWSKVKSLQIEILSAGFEDPGGKNSIIKVDGIDYSEKGRGFHVVVLSGTSGEVISKGYFGVHRSSEIDRMTEYINQIENGHIVLISAMDDVSEYMTTLLEERIHLAFGATTRFVLKKGIDDVRFRGSFALVAKKGGKKPFWFVEKAADRSKGPSCIEVQIPIGWY